MTSNVIPLAPLMADRDGEDAVWDRIDRRLGGLHLQIRKHRLEREQARRDAFMAATRERHGPTCDGFVDLPCDTEPA